MIGRMKALEDENGRLKKMYAEMSRHAELLTEALGKMTRPFTRRESSGVRRRQHCTGLLQQNACVERYNAPSDMNGSGNTSSKA